MTIVAMSMVKLTSSSGHSPYLYPNPVWDLPAYLKTCRSNSSKAREAASLRAQIGLCIRTRTPRETGCLKRTNVGNKAQRGKPEHGCPTPTTGKAQAGLSLNHLRRGIYISSNPTGYPTGPRTTRTKSHTPFVPRSSSLPANSQSGKTNHQPTNQGPCSRTKPTPPQR